MSEQAISLTRAQRRTRAKIPAIFARGPHCRAIERMLANHLPPLQVKIRKRMLGDLAGRIVDREGENDLYIELEELPRLAATILHLRNVVPALGAELAEISGRMRRLVRAHDGASSDRDRQRLLAEHIGRSGEGRWRRRGDLAALRRHLDLDALRERSDKARHHRLVLIELSLDFIAGALEAIARDDSKGAKEARALLEKSDLAAFVVGYAERSPRWQTRRASIRATLALAMIEVELGSELLDRLRERVHDVHEHPWVQAAVVDVLWQVDAPSARAITRKRLLEPSDHPHDFLVRRLLLDRIHLDDQSALELLEAVQRDSDPAEHVRQGISAAALRLLPSEARALDVLARQGGGGEHRGDPSPRVRALAARALVGALGEGMGGALELLRSWLEHEREELPLKVACHELLKLLERLADADQQEAERGRLRALVPALVELSTTSEVSASVQELAASTLETLDRTQNPARNALVQQLRTALARTKAPGSCRVTLGPELSRPVVGRALAELTRADWGIVASIRRRQLRLRRGDRFTTKLWRVLHELRNPAPNKRQGHRHTIGRSLRGTLRAHSGALDEITPTVVPGERVHIEAEGGWGRHVPTVDDASSLPLLRSRPVELYSSFGVTRLRASASLVRRLWSRAKLVVHYAELSALRSTSLDSSDPEVRRRYLTVLRDRYGIEVTLEPSPPIDGHTRRLPARITSLVPKPAPERLPSAKAGLALAPGAVDPSGLPRFDEWLDTNIHYFLSAQANQQTSLAWFLLGAFGLFLGDSYRRRRSIDKARAQVPLCIGGWGTRGKSGTERIKAGLFHGLGYQVFSKTTGCEAMMIHSIPEGPSSEIFVFRPYGKATIWEQRNLLELGAALRCDVFLWECMALNPKYVEVLQERWMRDDLSTLTNAYPDHEDVQGPAGIDVANAISSFIPHRGTLITSEINFLPLFAEVCQRRRSELLAIGPDEGDLIAPELLELFPYQEHPRNIALVARMAEHLEIDRDLAIVTMAQHVVPDLGVLKRYPPVLVRGRSLEFINGCSANERAGFLANWERTGCAALAQSDDPRQWVITVVNNREDRISRSEVFARILVQDTVADRHVLIGTNLQGLRAYLRASLATFCKELVLVRPVDTRDHEGHERARARLRSLMRRLRIPEPEVEVLVAHLQTYGQGCGLGLVESEFMRETLARVLGEDGSTELSTVLRELEDDRELARGLAEGLVPVEIAPRSDRPEVVGPCSREELEVHFLRQLARSVVRVRLQRSLDALLARGDAGEIEPFEAEVHAAYRMLFEDLIVLVPDAKTKGDAILQTCARCVPPGTEVRIMGTQNIKGTGLDFVYRFIAIDTVTRELKSHAEGDAAGRLEALVRLAAFADHGVADLGIVVSFLRGAEGRSAEERLALERLRSRVEPLYESKRAALQVDVDRERKGPIGKSNNKWLEATVDWFEGWVDFIDGARRFHASRKIVKDLVRGRISHPKAALLMREIYAREKGGWLYKRMFERA